MEKIKIFHYQKIKISLHTLIAEMDVKTSEPSMAEMTASVETTRVRIGQLWDEGLVTVEMLHLCILLNMYNIKSKLVDNVVLYMPKESYILQIGKVFCSMDNVTCGYRLHGFDPSNLSSVFLTDRDFFVCPTRKDLNDFVWTCRVMENNLNTAFDYFFRDEVEWYVSISWTKIKQTLDLILSKPQKHLRPVEHLVVEEVSKVLPVNDVPELVSSFLDNYNFSHAAIQSVCGKN